MEHWGMPPLRGRDSQKQTGGPKMLQGAVGETKGGGGGRVGTEPMQCFEEKMGNELMPRRDQGRSAENGLSTSWLMATNMSQ